MKKIIKKQIKKILILIIFIIIAIIESKLNIIEENQIDNNTEIQNIFYNNTEISKVSNNIEKSKISYTITDIPEYNGEIYRELNNNIPNFSAEDINLKQDYYSELENGRVRNSNDKNQLEKSKYR